MPHPVQVLRRGGALHLDHNKALGDPARLEVNSGTLDLNVRSGGDRHVPQWYRGNDHERYDGNPCSHRQSRCRYDVRGKHSGQQQQSLSDQAGSGRLLLSGSNSYTGDTYISDGELFINGDISRGNLVFVDDHATFGGSGAAGNVHVAASGILAPAMASARRCRVSPNRRDKGRQGGW